ncbi:MAG: serine/threonine protein kinase, partial [Oscillospiraceae bacterium]
MKDELKEGFDELYFPANGFPSRILEKYEPFSCLKYSDNIRVYLFRERATQKKVIVKCGEEKVGEQLKREYDILSAADTQTAQMFPDVLDHFCEGDVHYYVREYTEGFTLNELVRIRGVLPPMEARAVTAEICSMVQRLRRAKPPIILRSIKPENNIACSDGKYSIIDLDTAQFIKENAKQDAPGMQQNAAPEQYAVRCSDKRTDVYALGMLLLFLSSGSYDTNVELPDNIRKIVNRCTDLRPYRRYSDAASLRRALLGRSAAAKVGYAASFAVMGGAVALAVSLFLPKPAANMTDGALISTATDISQPDFSETIQHSTSEPASEMTAQAENTPTSAETPPKTPEISPEGNVVFAEPRIERAVRLHLGLSDSDPIGADELDKVRSIVLYGDRDFKSYEEYQQFIWNGGWMEDQYIPYIQEPLELSDLTMFKNLRSFAVIKQNADTLPDMSGNTALKNCVIKYCPID